MRWRWGERRREETGAGEMGRGENEDRLEERGERKEGRVTQKKGRHEKARGASRSVNFLALHRCAL